MLPNYPAFIPYQDEDTILLTTHDHVVNLLDTCRVAIHYEIPREEAVVVPALIFATRETEDPIAAVVLDFTADGEGNIIDEVTFACLTEFRNEWAARVKYFDLADRRVIA